MFGHFIKLFMSSTLFHLVLWTLTLLGPLTANIVHRLGVAIHRNYDDYEDGES